MIKILFLLLLFATGGYSQCYDKEHQSTFNSDFENNLNDSRIDSLKTGQFMQIEYRSKDLIGTLVILKRTKKLEYYQVGKWTVSLDDDMFGAYEFDSCGFCKHEEYYQNLDSIKTSEVSREYTTYKNKKYVLETIQNYEGDTKIYDTFLIVNGKRKHHGMSKTITNGEVTYLRKYEWGKVVH